MPASDKSVYIAYTGGTIGMTRFPDGGYRPQPGLLGELMKSMRELDPSPLIPNYVIHEYDPLLDSSNMSPHNWQHIADDLLAHQDDYDAFIILHGTDTMAYTASALSFMLWDKGFDKTVILTGSQIPLVEVRSDARNNLITSLLIAGNTHIPEVCLFFNDKLMRGNRATKVNAGSFAAFDTPNYPPLATTGIDINVKPKRFAPFTAPLPSTAGATHILDTIVGEIRLFPGINGRLIENFLQDPLRGAILETYGAGNAPANDPYFINALKTATEHDKVLVSVTQCLQGTVKLDEYATGSALKDAGVIGGYDMIPEAALAKMLFLFSKGFSPDEVRHYMGQNLRGELTLPG